MTVTKFNPLHKNKIPFQMKLRGNRSRNSTVPLNLMMLPVVVLIILFCYIPMVGVVIAFQDFDVTKGFFGSDWVGLEHFRRVLSMPESFMVLRNTLVIAISKMVVMFFVPIVFAVLLNEVVNVHLKKTVQTFVYLPHFLSWVILAGILRSLLSSDGMVNMLLMDLGLDKINFLGDKYIFPVVIVVSAVWKEFGFSTIIYLAAIAGVDPALYEAATIDGAGRWSKIWHVTLPGMMAIIVLKMILSLSGILNAGFDQIFNLYSVPVYATSDVLDTFVYRISFSQGEYEIGTAVGLMKSFVSTTLIVTSYWMAYRFADYEIF